MLEMLRIDGSYQPSVDVPQTLRRGGVVADRVFDAVYNAEYQAASRRFWTPVRVARDAAYLFLQAGSRRVLDVGAGVGKFAIVASLATDLRVSGLEHRAHLVSEATCAASRYDASARFIHGALANAVPAEYDGIYLFNPFGENLLRASNRLDATVSLGKGRYARDVERIERWLSAAPVGFAMVTYNGFGGRIPCSFELVESLQAYGCYLRLWHKRRRAGDPDDFFVEHRELVLTSRGPQCPRGYGLKQHADGTGAEEPS
jgi:SAM-dependent methyltransferase